MTEVVDGYCGFGADDCLGLPWDSLRDQDWDSLGSSDAMLTTPWETGDVCDLGPPVDQLAALQGSASALRSHKHHDSISYMSAPAGTGSVSYGSWEGHPQAPAHGGVTSGTSITDRDVDRAMRAHNTVRMHQGGMISDDGGQGRPDWGYVGQRAPVSRPAHASSVGHYPSDHATSRTTQASHSNRPPEGRSMDPNKGRPLSVNVDHQQRMWSGNDMAHDGQSPMFLVHLFVVAIAEGDIVPGTPQKMLGVLDQVRRKVSKEQNTMVNLRGEGSLEVRLRVFVCNSLEAGAIGDYITSVSSQAPAPFVVLSQHLPMAVAYNPATIDPSQSSVADRLRKQMKTYAVKVIKEVMADRRCTISPAMLRGHLGPLAPADTIAKILAERSLPVAADPLRRYIIVPAKARLTASPANSPRPRVTAKLEPPVLQIPSPRNGPNSPLGMHASPLMSPDTSAPSTPCSVADTDSDDIWGHRPTAYFPVSLFVTAIADGALANDTPHKMHDRLLQIVRKVPKEQNTSVEVCEGHTIDLKMRVFVVNSEDAKAVGEYISSHMSQHPAPFVLLARHLPMAVLYDPNTLDLQDASVADRLRKQAKTRTVKVLREGIANKSLGVTAAMLRGHMGPLVPAQRLEAALSALTQTVEGEGVGGDMNRGNYIVFAARNKAASSAPSSPRKRTAGAAAGGGKKGGGAASASQLHRKILEKTLKKAKRSPPSAPDTPPATAAAMGMGRGR